MSQGRTDQAETSPVWVILGPTASGKGRLAVELGRRFPVEIVSVDSMKAYRGMDIGTATPSAEDREAVPHHMIDVLDPSEKFNVGKYCSMAEEAMDEIRARGRRPLLVGGSALYIKGLIWGLFEGPDAQPELRKKLRKTAEEQGSDVLHDRLKEIDPEAAGNIHPNDLKRIVRAIEVYEVTGEPLSEQQNEFDDSPRLESVMVGLKWPREMLHERINRRVDRMMEQGLLEEVKNVRPKLGPQAAQAVGYKELIQYLDGELTLEEAVERVKAKTRQLAKHQMTWFRKFEGLHWINPTAFEAPQELAKEAARIFSTGS